MQKNSIIAFDWVRDPKGYRIVDGIAVRQGPNGSEKRYRVRDGLFLIFMKTVTTADGLLRFMNAYGPLTEDGRDSSRGEAVDGALKNAKSMRQVYGWSAGNRKGLAAPPDGVMMTEDISMSAGLLWVPRSKEWHWKFVPNTLRAALWLQLGQKLAGETELHTCQHCRELFEAGRGTGRRLDAKFCSDEHRISYNSLRRSKET
jgi:hypothetical protein